MASCSRASRVTTSRGGTTRPGSWRRGSWPASHPTTSHDALRAIDVDDPLRLPGTGALAVGALPFDPAVACELIVPARIVGEVGGRAWVTEIGPAPIGDAASTRRPSRFTVAASRTRAQWDDAVRAALAMIATGDLGKVVLAREVMVEADAPFDLLDVLRRLRTQQPGCFVYACEGLVGASPELLVRRMGDTVESRPVAGTTVADDDEALHALAHSAKDNREHGFVVEAITDALAQVCGDLEVGMVPDVAVFGPVARPRDAHPGTHRRPRARCARHRPAPPPHPGGRRDTTRCGARGDPGARGLRPRSLRGARRVGRRARQRRMGDRAALRGARRCTGTPGGGCRHRRGLRPGRRVGRDPGEARAHAPRPHPSLARVGRHSPRRTLATWRVARVRPAGRGPALRWRPGRVRPCGLARRRRHRPSRSCRRRSGRSVPPR